MSIIKKGMRKLGIGRKHDYDNNAFILDAIWPLGTWNQLAQGGVSNVEMDRAVRSWLIDVYLYDEKRQFKEKHATLAWHAPSFVKLPFDWNPSVEMIRGLHTGGDDFEWSEEDITYIITRLAHLNHLKA